jgi:hypothetical protein
VVQVLGILNSISFCRSFQRGLLGDKLTHTRVAMALSIQCNHHPLVYGLCRAGLGNSTAQPFFKDKRAVVLPRE